jgi:hypothetical protein
MLLIFTETFPFLFNLSKVDKVGNRNKSFCLTIDLGRHMPGLIIGHVSKEEQHYDTSPSPMIQID